jgi:hypothetical protein
VTLCTASPSLTRSLNFFLLLFHKKAINLFSPRFPFLSAIFHFAFSSINSCSRSHPDKTGSESSPYRDCGSLTRSNRFSLKSPSPAFAYAFMYSNCRLRLCKGASLLIYMICACAFKDSEHFGATEGFLSFFTRQKSSALLEPEKSKSLKCIHLSLNKKRGDKCEH